MKRLIIIGGNSIIAKSIYELYSTLFAITSFSRTKINHKNVDSVKIDWNSPSVNQLEILKNAEFVVYCIGETNGSEEHIKKVNIDLLRKISTYLNSNQKVIFISSVATIINESYYAKSKLIGEDIIRDNFKEYVILRPSVIYGKYDKKNLAKIKKILKILPIVPILKPDLTIQPIFVEDIASLIGTVIKDNRFTNESYELSGPKPLPTREVLNQIKSKHNISCLFIPVPIKIIKNIFKVLLKVSPFKVPLAYQIINLKSHGPICSNKAIEELDFKQTEFDKGYMSF